MMLVRMVRTGSWTMSCTPTAAARWTTTSDSLVRRSNTCALSTVSRTNWKCGQRSQVRDVLHPAGGQVVNGDHPVPLAQQKFT